MIEESALETSLTSLGFPSWLLVVAFFFTFAISSINLISWIYGIFSRAVVKLKVTNDFFERVSNAGETFFINSIFLVLKRDIEIVKVNFFLKKLNCTNQREFTLKVTDIGEKSQQKDKFFAEHFFYTTSCIDLVKKDSVNRRLYRVVIDERDAKLAELFDEYSQEVQNFAPGIRSDLENDDKEVLIKMKNFRETKVKQLKLKIKNEIQIESGKYLLTQKVVYRSLSFFWNKINSETSSSIEFEIGTDFDSKVERDLDVWMDSILKKTISGNNSINEPFPNYVPKKIFEK